MPRRQTPAHERTQQNEKLIAEVSAELGVPTSRRKAEEYRRTQRGVKPGTNRYAVPDVELNFAPEDLRFFGQFTARFTDKRSTNSYVQMTLVSSPGFGHLLEDALLKSSHPFLITLEEIHADVTDEVQEEADPNAEEAEG